ncbi:hypothetical protein L3X38_038789 [Prunus dulcis]|uniref:Uncharacterized protein n=1 Tax=Prunus dulcis TaxID=3755 RepID=A0AAD4V840_PRUDU|nr:hypothetical protein L3X38_038789 [Prunus dulcis]
MVFAHNPKGQRRSSLQLQRAFGSYKHFAFQVFDGPVAQSLIFWGPLSFQACTHGSFESPYCLLLRKS